LGRAIDAVGVSGHSIQDCAQPKADEPIILPFLPIDYGNPIGGDALNPGVFSCDCWGRADLCVDFFGDRTNMMYDCAQPEFDPPIIVSSQPKIDGATP
jgi:hypothetical protein